MPKKVSDTRTRAIIVAALALLGIIGASIILSNNNASGGSQVNTTTTAPPRLGEGTITYTVSLAPGTIIKYTSYFEINYQGNSTSGTINYTALILDVQWPMTTVNYTILDTNQSQAAPVAITNLALPETLLGEENLDVPITVPGAQTGACVRLVLDRVDVFTVGEETREAYVYRFSYNASGILVDGVIAYDKETGLALLFNTSITDPSNEISTFNSQRTIEYDIAGTVGVATPVDWFCKPPVSSDIRFTIEGIYRARGVSFQPASSNEVREASQDKALILIISKDNQQLTAKFWKEFLKAAIAFQDKAEFYVIVQGPLSSREQLVFANYLLQQTGAVEGNVLILMENGASTGKVYSIGDYNDIVNLVLQAYPDP